MSTSLSSVLSQLTSLGANAAPAAAAGGGAPATAAPAPPTAPTAPPALPSVPPPTAPLAKAAGGGPTGGVDAALIGALSQLVTVLEALVQSLQGQQQLLGGGGAPPAKGGGPVQSPVQSPLQVPTQGGGATPAAPAAPPVSGGGPAPAPAAGTTALQPITGYYDGPSVGISSNPNDPTSYVIRSGSQTGASTYGNLQFFGRYGSATGSRGFGQNEVSLSGSALERSTRVAIPDAGSLTLSSGATFSWNAADTPGRLQGIRYGELSFNISRPGQGTAVVNAALDRARGYDDAYVSPLSQAETVELTQLLARTYPAAT